MRTIEELKLLLTIDRNRLDEELVQQPQLYYEASEGYTDAAAKRDLSKLVLEQLEANIGKEYRSQSLEKVSDKRVNEHVTSHQLYTEQYERYLNYKSDAEKWDALVDAFRQRSSMARDLVQLMSIGFWSAGPASTLTQNYAEKYKQKREADKTKE